MIIPTRIHPTAIISRKANIGSNVDIGPYSIIDDDVIIGDNCQIGSHVVLRDGTKFGTGCRVFKGAVIGELPQDLKYKGGSTSVEIGNDVIIREYVTIHRGTDARGKTTVGDKCYFMAYVHIAHDCIIGENVIIANAVQLGGHVSIDDWANIGGMTPIHQFCKVGKYTFIAGGYRAVQDVPPYILAAGEPLKYSGVNNVGLKRHGFSSEVRKNIKDAYKLIFRSSYNIGQAIDTIKDTLPQSDEIKEIITFVESSERGLI